MKKQCDVLIVGTGAAGLYCALNLPPEYSIQLITKQDAEASDSFLAQGGICVLRGEEDYSNYFEDTLRAGHYKNDPKSVEVMIRSSNAIIRTLIAYGVSFECASDGKPAYTREGAHSRPRILYHADITGKEITSTLLARVREKPNITLCEHVTMLDLLERDGVCGGLIVQKENGETVALEAPYTVLCTGGLGGLYQNSTNYPHITGDALAIALRHGIPVAHLDYIQIHPTTLYSKKPGRRFLISESVRGEGALLYGRDGKRFTDELQSRDVLTKQILAQMAQEHTDFVWEDLRPIGETAIRSHFPNIHQRCLEEGFDVMAEPIPVVPAQHYFMGGIQVNLAGQTSMKGLYACGETSCNGVHGANRLASNSLLESLVFAQRAAEDILFGQSHRGGVIPFPVDLSRYEDSKALLSQYHTLVLENIERVRCHE